MKQTNSQQIIGSTTVVDIPQATVFNVPSKVDTGADSSSIWATNIHELDGTLAFELFAPGSPFYNGQIIRTKNFVIRSIKNSFGQTEFRYKVPLKIVIEGKVIVARLTLSDRTQNKYPVLIGRRTLQGKFIVDVSKRRKIKSSTQPSRLLVLVNSGGAKFDTFYNALNHDHKNDFNADIVRYEDLIYTIHAGNLEIKNAMSQQDLATYNLIYFKTATRNAEFASIIAGYARRHFIPYIDMAVERLAPNSKIHQLALMCLADITIPDTTFISPKLLINSYDTLVNDYGPQFVLKDNHGRKGRHNYLVTTCKDFDEALASAAQENVELLAQKFITNTGYYRVLVLGKQVALVMFRPVDQARSYLFEAAVDGPAQLLRTQDLPGEVLAMCIRAADQLGWQIAGVDVIQDKLSGKWYCLEVNNSPQLVSGAFVDEKRAALASFFKQQMDK